MTLPLQTFSQRHTAVVRKTKRGAGATGGDAIHICTPVNFQAIYTVLTTYNKISQIV